MHTASSRFFVGATVALACVAWSCARTEPEAADTPPSAVAEALDPLGDLAEGSRANAERALEARLDDLHDALAEWTQSAQEHGAEGRDKIVAELELREAQLRGELDALRQSGADAWRELCRQTQQESAKLAEQCRQLFETR